MSARKVTPMQRQLLELARRDGSAYLGRDDSRKAAAALERKGLGVVKARDFFVAHPRSRATR